MYDNYNYPAGADTPDAPWNKWEPEEKAFDVDVEVALFKRTKVITKDYDMEYDDETGRMECITSNTDWNKAYEDCEPSITDMLEELKDYIEKELNENNNIEYLRKRKLQLMLEAADGWKIKDTYISD